jgi:hypothetical protein
MKPHEIFALVVRIVGLLSLVYILASATVFILLGLQWAFVIKTLVWIAVSLWFLRGAPQLVRFAYPDSK